MWFFPIVPIRDWVAGVYMGIVFSVPGPKTLYWLINGG
jgi:hypothetical protein